MKTLLFLCSCIEDAHWIKYGFLWYKLFQNNVNLANILKCQAWQKAPKFFAELESKFGETLSNKEDGVNQIIDHLQEKLRVFQNTDRVYKLNNLHSCNSKEKHSPVGYQTVQSSKRAIQLAKENLISKNWTWSRKLRIKIQEMQMTLRSGFLTGNRKTVPVQIQRKSKTTTSEHSSH